jgi:hypothetical protein
MNRTFTHLLALCLALLLVGCSSHSTGSARFAVSVPQALSSSVSRVSVTASAADFSPVSVDLVFSNGVWDGTLGSIPAGASRSFLAQAFDSSGTLLFQGSASDVSISADQTSLVALTLQQVNAPPPFQNEAPVIDSLVSSPTSTSVPAGSSLALTATAHDPNPGDTLTYAWSSTAGVFSSTTEATTSWTAPASTGIQTLTLTVTDAKGLSSSLFLAVNVLPSGGQGHAQFSITFNTAPQVTALGTTASRVAVGQTTSVSVSASDLDGDSLAYSWSASCAGSWAQASSSSAQFTPDALPAGTCNNCDLTVSVSDGRGGRTTGIVALCVNTTPAPQHFPPHILSASGSSHTATAGQVLTYEVTASDAEDSALSFSWAANTGALGTPVHDASSSRITWTAPSCVAASAPPLITATVTNAFNLTTTKSFSVLGLPVCVPSRWASAGAMASPRRHHTATLLPNGKVLVAGGAGPQGPLATAELYDPASGTWSTTGSMHSARDSHTATLLPNGKVLVSPGFGPSDTAEVYDPASGTWSTTGLLVWRRSSSTATLLPNGKVLLAAGEGSELLATAEVFDAAAGTGTWKATTSMAIPRYRHRATLLPNGQVLVTGGIHYTGPIVQPEKYDPASGTWSAAGSMTSARYDHTATLLPNGKLFVTGGGSWNGALATAEVYDPASGTWSAAASMAEPRSEHTATLLPNGKLLVAGGNVLATAEYDPASDTWSATASMAKPRFGHTATLLNNGKVLVVGGTNGALSVAELYTPGTP